jgi:pimeloyl-ACP methyl ester carboxylesterase
MATFVFVHGGYERGSCFSRVAHALGEKGHSAIAVDLPPNDTVALPPSAVGLEAYRSYVCDVIADIAEPVVLVGHSLGGVTISAVAEAIPHRIRDLVYLSALMLDPGYSVRTFRERFYGHGAALSSAQSQRTVSDDGSTASVGPDGARQHFYNCCSLEDQQAGIDRIRPQPLKVYDDILELTAQRWGAIRRTYVLALRDQGLPPNFSAFMLDVVGAHRTEVIDADHSSFLSAPGRVVRLLEALL